MSRISISLASIIIVAILVVYLTPTIHAQQDLYVHVVDLDGKPRVNVEVRVIKEGFSRIFITNSTGYAVFKGLTSDTYTVEAIIRDVVVARKVIEFPKESYVKLVLEVSPLNIIVLDTKEKPVQGIMIRIKDSGGRVSLSGTTDEFGIVSFTDVPHSSLDGIGNYTAEAFVDGISVASSQFSIPEKTTVKLSAKLVNLNITVTNMDGKKVPQVKVTIRSGNFSKSLTGPEGLVTFWNVPSSDLLPTRYYTIEVTRTVITTPITIYRENRSVTSDMALDVVASLGTLRFRVIDEDGNPIKGLNVMVSHGLVANFTILRTDTNGTVTLVNAPLSTPPSNVGDYTLLVFKGNSYIGKFTTRMVSAFVEETFVVKFSKAMLAITDFEGIPLANVTVKARDIVLDTEYEAKTGKDGCVELKILPGPYEVKLEYMGRTVHFSVMDLGDGIVNMRLNSVNYPVTVFVMDSIGTRIGGLRLQVNFEGKNVFDGTVNREGIKLTLPYPGELVVSLFMNGELLQRRIFQLTGPEELKIRISDKLAIGGSLIDVSLIVQTITFAFLFASLAGLLYTVITLWRARIRRKPQSPGNMPAFSPDKHY